MRKRELRRGGHDVGRGLGLHDEQKNEMSGSRGLSLRGTHSSTNSGDDYSDGNGRRYRRRWGRFM